jgi:hypothetical protein
MGRRLGAHSVFDRASVRESCALAGLKKQAQCTALAVLALAGRGPGNTTTWVPT